MRCTILLASLLILSSCTPQQPSEDEVIFSEPQEVKLIKSIFHEKVVRNGAQSFCNQYSLLECMNYTEEECTNKLSPHIEPCADYALSFMGETLTESTFDDFGGTFSECVFTRYRGDELLKVKIDLTSTYEPLNCVYEVEIDEELYMRTMMD